MNTDGNNSFVYQRLPTYLFNEPQRRVSVSEAMRVSAIAIRDNELECEGRN